MKSLRMDKAKEHSARGIFTFLFILSFCFLTTRTYSQIEINPRFKVLVLAESGGHHVEYTIAAKVWLTKLAADSSFSIDYIQTTEKINDDFLNQYQLFIQLDFPPYMWSEASKHAFENYLQKGKGGWIGFHHATLLGEFDGYAMWNWYSDFMGGIQFKDYIPTFAKATVNVEDKNHPCVRGILKSFSIEKEEWYTYNKSPRLNVHVIASVDESTYSPDSEIKMGDHPVIWINERFATRNIYIFMGHSPNLFNNQNYTTLFRNSIFWATAFY